MWVERVFPELLVPLLYLLTNSKVQVPQRWIPPFHVIPAHVLDWFSWDVFLPTSKAGLHCPCWAQAERTHCKGVQLRMQGSESHSYVWPLKHPNPTHLTRLAILFQEPRSPKGSFTPCHGGSVMPTRRLGVKSTAMRGAWNNFTYESILWCEPDWTTLLFYMKAPFIAYYETHCLLAKVWPGQLSSNGCWW